MKTIDQEFMPDDRIKFILRSQVPVPFVFRHKHNLHLVRVYIGELLLNNNDTKFMAEYRELALNIIALANGLFTAPSGPFVMGEFDADTALDMWAQWFGFFDGYGKNEADPPAKPKPGQSLLKWWTLRNAEFKKFHTINKAVANGQQ